MNSISTINSPNIFALVTRAIRLYGDQDALVFNGDKVSYSELEAQVEILKQRIISKIPQEKLIAVSSARSINSIVNILAVLSAGKAYLPIDFDVPEDRLRKVVSETNVRYGLPGDINESFHKIDVLEITDALPDNPEVENVEAEEAYVLFTSGSTGVPKGISIPHVAVINLIDWQNENSISGPGYKTLHFAKLTFDVSVQEIFATLTSGGTLFIAENSTLKDPLLLLEFIEKHEINRLFFPFIALQGLFTAANAYQIYPKSLKEIMNAGEQLKVSVAVRKFFKNMEGCVLYNQYGPTETTVVMTQLPMGNNPDSWDDLPSIGKAIPQTEVRIVDAEGNLITEPGVIGEIYISGLCLALGYYNKPELTSEKFVDLSFEGEKVKKYYKSGDLAEWNSNWELQFKSRIDDQVKINGFRVELSDIEANVSQIEGIDENAVITDYYKDGQLFLKLFYTSGDSTLTNEVIRRKLEKVLPEYMIPAQFIKVQYFPKTTSSKVDRNALLKSYDYSLLSKSRSTEQESKNIAGVLISIWREVLQVEEFTSDSNFFNLGGSSILVQKLSLAVSEKLGIRFPVAFAYQYPTLRSQVKYLSDNNKGVLSQYDKPAQTIEGAKSKAVAVIAMAGKFPKANSVGEFWEMVKNEREGISFFDLEDLDPLIRTEAEEPNYIKARGIIDEVEKFDAEFFGMNPKLAAVMDPQQRLFLEISYEALEKAGWIANRPEFKIGVFAGTNNNTYYTKNIVFDQELHEIFGPIQVMSLNEKDYVSSRTAYHLNLKGPAVSVFSACSTSLLAVAQAVQSIRSGQCVAALAGGSSVVFPVKSGQRHEEGAIFTSDGHCRPFDAGASGTLFCDGAGVVLLKSYEHALADGDPIFAVIKGIGVNNDGSEKGSFTSPSVLGEADAIRSAMVDADVQPEQISYVEAHGTATPIGDPIEIEGLKLAFGANVPNHSCAVGSVKSNIGHLTAASGIAGLIKTIYALHEKILPASIGYQNPNPEIDFAHSPFYVQQHTTTWSSDQKRIAGVSSFGFGGTNVHVILEEFAQENEPENDLSNREILVTFSAKTEKSLASYAHQLNRFVQERPVLDLSQLSYNLLKRDAHYGLQHVFRASSRGQLLYLLKEASEGTLKPIQRLGNYATPVFLFPGQGAQYPGMGKSLYEANEVFRLAFDQCCTAFDQYLPTSLKMEIFEGTAETLANTLYTQPAIFTVSYSMSMTLIDMGIQPAAFCGHSIGEYVGAHLAGIFSLEDAIKVVAYRGKLISELPGGNMLSVRSKTDVIKELLPDNLSLAAQNAPNLCVVSGPVDAIEAFKTILDGYDIPSQILKTSHAFHSKMMDGALEEFSRIVASVNRYIPKVPIMSTQTGKWLTDAEAQSVDYWTGHLRNAVLFNEAAASLLEELPEAFFLEAGPGNVLNSLIQQQPEGKKNPVVHTLSRSNIESETSYLIDQLGVAYSKGAKIDLASVLGFTRFKFLDIPTYAFDKKLCWNQKGALVNPFFLKKANQAPVVNEFEEVVVYNQTVSESGNSSYSIHRHFGKIREMLESASGVVISENDVESSFFELGLDSLVLTQFSFSLQKEFGVKFSFKQLNDSLNSPKAVLDFLDDSLPKSTSQPDAVQASPTKFEAVKEAGSETISLLQDQLDLIHNQLHELKDGPNTNGQKQSNPDKILRNGQISEDELIELKKPFGYMARIERQGTELSLTAKRFLKTFEQEYNEKTGKSKMYSQEYRRMMADPRVVSGFKPEIKELIYPIVTNQSKGSRIMDLDGNEYLDWLNGFGTNMFGYSPEFITEALKRQLDEGFEIGTQHVLAGEVSKLICKLTGSERVGLCNTGSEAVMVAIRIARTVSSKPLIVAFSGSNHGINDEVLVRGTKSGKTFPAVPGILEDNVQQILILEYGSEESIRILTERAEEIAAVLVEPVQCRTLESAPVEFLKSLRAVTESFGICLIFDELITGFRAHPRGVQHLFGIKADLVTYGKVVGGGLPIGIIGGKAKWMDALDGGFWQYGDDSIPESGVTYFAGTFVKHPLVLAAAKAVLLEMDKNGPALQDALSERTAELVERMNTVFEKFNCSYYAVNYKSIWKIKLKSEIPYWELLFTLLRNKGIHIWENFPCFMTAAHTRSDIDFTIEKLESVLEQLIENEIINGDLPDLEEVLMDSNNPPFPGAKIGFDEEGNPIWIHPSKK
ncbi:MAG: aminotransferase class III-fold pyridoxal phosphate-dependent enzyme [Algoriphagus sp.]|nr:aminotransferase class III-fold pyridoxal phosphate-dependent enzyme [Algoriphagus sp.]